MVSKAEVITGDLSRVVEHLSGCGFHNLYIDGGKVIQGFLKENLVDEMIITRIPIILGGGIPLFGILANPLKFSKVKTEILTDQMVKSYYFR